MSHLFRILERISWGPLVECGLQPKTEYESRLARWRSAFDREDRTFRALGNYRLLTAIAGVVLAYLAFGPLSVPVWSLLFPIAIFIVLVIWHERVHRRQSFASRGISYYQRALARIADQWMGTGNPGERFRDGEHVYADDLDIFGRGSLYQLLCTARTAAGEEMLAEWLRAPSTTDQVVARQLAVAELRERVDLREDLALLGDDVRAGVHADVLARWGDAPAVHFPRAMRVILPAVTAAVVLTGLLYVFSVTRVSPFLVVVLAVIGLTYALRGPVGAVLVGAETPARDLKILSLLLARLEKEQFTSPRLAELRATLNTAGLPASRQIAKLHRLLELLDSAKNQIFVVPAFLLLWVPQFAMAIEAWRRVSGPHVGQWIAAVGEMEALCSLAAFAYERPESRLPEIVAGPCFEATELRHPLIARAACIPNDVALTPSLRLLIVSGSNMSGKSTLLRAIGLNTVLAWAGGTVLADSLRISPLSIGASIRVSDSVQDGKSRFYAEITRLRQVVDLTTCPRPALFLLDELLSGTNSHDRRIGAEAVVLGLVERGAIGLVTTHDLALVHIAETLGSRANNIHFEDRMEKGEIHFDYKIRQGVVERSNALELMRAVGLDV